MASPHFLVSFQNKSISIDPQKLMSNSSPKLKRHLLTLVSKYKNNSCLVKIRRQGVKQGPGLKDTPYFTDDAKFKIKQSFYIETNPDNPNLCSLHFANHKQQIKGGFGRVVSIPIILNLDLENQTISPVKQMIHGRPIERMKVAKKIQDPEPMDLTRMARANHDLKQEMKLMPRFNPSRTSRGELPYKLFEDRDNKKLRFFMPDKGVSLVDAFNSFSWKKRSTNELLKFGNGKMSAAEQLCRKVAKIHQNDYVHRDLKPENILINNLGGRLDVSLCDFAFTCKTKQMRPWNGTALYSPIEEIQLALSGFERTHEPSSDSYALCLILAQWLFFKDFQTITEDNRHHCIHLSKKQIEAKGCKIRDQITESDPLLQPLIELILKGFSRTPELRPSATELADCINQISAQQLEEPHRATCCTII